MQDPHDPDHDGHDPATPADSADESASVFRTLQEGDRVLYNEKRSPLTVVSVSTVDSDSGDRGIREVVVKGPQGGRYVLFVAPDNAALVLESRSGNRDYASAVRDLRIVGAWEQEDGDTWVHSQTGATVALERNAARKWTMTVSGFDGESPDIPKYGFMSRKYAVEAVHEFIAAHPEG